MDEKRSEEAKKKQPVCDGECYPTCDHCESLIDGCTAYQHLYVKES